jgi:bacillithiol biosynthesis deacetylase BshB1
MQPFDWSPLVPPLDVLVVAPHPDDAEISVGGMVLQAVRAGLRVGIVELTDGEPTPQGTIEQRRRETAEATQVLGIAWRTNLGLPNRQLQDDPESRRLLAEVFRLTRPQLVLAPYWEDAHPDHVAASALVDGARFWAKLSRTDLRGAPWWPPRIFYFWSIHLRIHPAPAFVLDISDAIEDKMHAVGCYQSQLVTGRSTEFPTIVDDIRDRARYWGWSIGTAYAEPFASREEFAVRDIRSLFDASASAPNSTQRT